MVSLKDFTARDTRKPNSTGVDFAVDKANKQHYMLGEYVGISKADNRQVTLIIPLLSHTHAHAHT